MTAPRLTKKALREALTPLRMATERAALAMMAGTRQPPVTPVEFNGVTIDTQIVRRARVVCGVPAPYYAVEIWYEAKDADGKRVLSAGNGGEFVNAYFHMLARQGA